MLAETPLNPEYSFNDVVIGHATKHLLQHQELPMSLGYDHLLARAIHGSGHMVAR